MKQLDVKQPSRVLALAVAAIAVAGCTTSPSPVVALGIWGGPHVTMEVTSGGARLEYDCGEGMIEEPLRPDGTGRFVAAGLHTPGHGGPIRVGEVLPSFRARYEGQLDGDRMTLRVTRTDNGVVLGPFALRRGTPGLLVRCL